jgi:hypothetical protein
MEAFHLDYNSGSLVLLITTLIVMGIFAFILHKFFTVFFEQDAPMQPDQRLRLEEIKKINQARTIRKKIWEVKQEI